MKPYTQWLRYDDKKQAYVHNHIEHGWVKHDRPISKHPDQEIWKTMKWKKRFTRYNNKMQEVSI